VAWYDAEGTELQLLTRAEDGPLLAVPSPSGAAGGGDGPAATCEPEGTELAIAAVNLAFDTDCLAAPAGEPFTIGFDNQEAVPHNLAIYDSEAAAQEFFVGEVFTGPATQTYDVEPIDEEGELFFRCDVHPSTMTGTFVVAGGGGGGGE
jgi:plastocyanin